MMWAVPCEACLWILPSAVLHSHHHRRNDNNNSALKAGPVAVAFCISAGIQQQQAYQARNSYCNLEKADCRVVMSG